MLKQKIFQRFGLAVGFEPAHVLYKETIAAPVEGVGHFEPLRHYAEVHLWLEPGEQGSGLQFAMDCPRGATGGKLAKAGFVPSGGKGVDRRFKRTVL